MAQKKQNKMLKEFVPEAEELMDMLQQNLSQIAEMPTKESIRPEVINTLFRAAHTLKGMAGMVGLNKVAQVSHHFEDVLDKVRLGKSVLTPALLNLLIDGVSLLQTSVKAAVLGKEGPDVSFFEDRVRLTMAEKPKGEEDTLLSGLDLGPSFPNLLTEYEQHRLIQNIKTSARLYEVVATFPLDTFDTDLAALTARIQKVGSGEVIATLPGPSPTGGMEFRLVVGVSQEYPPLESQMESDPRLVLRVLSQKQNKPASPTAVAAREDPAPLMPAAQHLPEQQPEMPSDTAILDDLESIRSLSQTVRVDIEKLDILLNMVGELVISKNQISQLSQVLMDREGASVYALEVQKASKALDKRVSLFQEKLVEVRMTPIGQIFERLVRVVQKVSKDLGKEVNLAFSGEETRMDKSMVEDLADPLLHLILNALDHGLESPQERLAKGKPVEGSIQVRAFQRGNDVVIEVEDDGRGINGAKVYEKAVSKGLISTERQYSQEEWVRFLFLPGFSTKEEVTQVSGRGVGLDVVAKNITKLSGMVDVETILGQGTLFTLTLPITLVIIKALIIKVASETFAVPLSSVLQSLAISDVDIKTIESQEAIQLRDETLMLVRLAEFFGLGKSEQRKGQGYVIVVGLGEKRMGLLVDDIKGQQEVVIKSLGRDLENLEGISGVTEIGNGSVILVLDVTALVQEVTKKKGADKSYMGIGFKEQVPR